MQEYEEAKAQVEQLRSELHEARAQAEASEEVLRGQMRDLEERLDREKKRYVLC